MLHKKCAHNYGPDEHSSKEQRSSVVNKAVMVRCEHCFFLMHSTSVREQVIVGVKY